MSYMKLAAALIVVGICCYSNVVEAEVADVPECHWKAVDKCMYAYFYFTHRPNTTGIVPNPQEFELMCKVTRKVFRCIEKFMERCGTDFFAGTFSLVKDQIVNSFNQLCAPGPMKTNFLKFSPCIHKQVKSDQTYKKTCVNDLQAGLELMTKKDSVEDMMNTGCCVYNIWEDCITNMTLERCGGVGEGGEDAVHDLIEKASGGLIHLICKRNFYDPNSEFCQSKKAPPGTQALGRNSNSIFSKYFTFICPNTGW